MAGPIKMYAMRPIVRHDLPVQLPTCMYRLPRIQGDAGDDVDAAAKRSNGTAAGRAPRTSPSATNVELVAEQVKQFLKNNQAMTMALVQERQEAILKKLEALKVQMTAIRDTLKADATTTAKSGKAQVVSNTQPGKLNTKQLPTEVTINVNPTHPPYSLLFLQKLWKSALNINVQSYVHSTVSNLPEAAQGLVESLKANCETTPGAPTLTVRLIWKAIGVNHLELTGARTIQGEVNLLRYLARLTHSLSYDEDDEMDSYLDACYNISRSKTKAERVPLFQRLNKKLAKEKFIFGGFSIVDVAAYSAIKQTAAAGEVNVGMTKWMNNCEAY